MNIVIVVIMACGRLYRVICCLTLSQLQDVIYYSVTIADIIEYVGSSASCADALTD